MLAAGGRERVLMGRAVRQIARSVGGSPGATTSHPHVVAPPLPAPFTLALHALPDVQVHVPLQHGKHVPGLHCQVAAYEGSDGSAAGCARRHRHLCRCSDKAS